MATQEDEADEKLDVSGRWAVDSIQLNQTAMTDDIIPAVRTQTEVNIRD